MLCTMVLILWRMKTVTQFKGLSAVSASISFIDIDKCNFYSCLHLAKISNSPFKRLFSLSLSLLKQRVDFLQIPALKRKKNISQIQARL